MSSFKEVIEKSAYKRRPKTFEDAVDLILAAEKEIMMERHKKYGNGNISKRGEMGVIVRLEDKIERAGNILFGKADDDATDESLADTYGDIANYGSIALMVRSGLWDLPDTTLAPMKPASARRSVRKKARVSKPTPSVTEAPTTFTTADRLVTMTVPADSVDDGGSSHTEP